jgi:3-phosphoshikimate 1-carboxyvinyltransferase
MTDTRTMVPVSRPLSGTIRPPGSKSLTNRALVVAALAQGTSRLTGVLDSRDTQVMIDSLRRLGIDVKHSPAECTAVVTGCAGRPPVSRADLWLENSGTSIRFLTALCALGSGTYRLDGNTRMRERPIGDLIQSLRQFGITVTAELGTDCPPVVVTSNGLRGGTTTVNADVSSQFLSAILMAAPCAHETVEIHLAGTMVSEPYVEMTRQVMEQFGVRVNPGAATDSLGRYVVPPQTYLGRDYDIEPDASAAKK